MLYFIFGNFICFPLPGSVKNGNIIKLSMQVMKENIKYKNVEFESMGKPICFICVIDEHGILMLRKSDKRLAMQIIVVVSIPSRLIDSERRLLLTFGKRSVIMSSNVLFSNRSDGMFELLLITC